MPLDSCRSHCLLLHWSSHHLPDNVRIMIEGVREAIESKELIDIAEEQINCFNATGMFLDQAGVNRVLKRFLQIHQRENNVATHSKCSSGLIQSLYLTGHSHVDVSGEEPIIHPGVKFANISMTDPSGTRLKHNKKEPWNLSARWILNRIRRWFLFLGIALLISSCKKNDRGQTNDYPSRGRVIQNQLIQETEHCRFYLMVLRTQTTRYAYVTYCECDSGYYANTSLETR